MEEQVSKSQIMYVSQLETQLNVTSIHKKKNSWVICSTHETKVFSERSRGPALMRFERLMHFHFIIINKQNHVKKIPPFFSIIQSY